MAKTTKADREFIDGAMKRLKMAVDADAHNRAAAIEDLEFILPGGQWSPQEKKRRADKGRPVLEVPLLPKFIEQVVGDMLQNSPTIKIRPVDSKSDVRIANIRQGIISEIEYNSNSKGIYGYASRQMVTCGYGAWRILTRYTEENPFLQEAYIEGIRNPFLIYMDPSSKDQNYADAKWGFLLEKVPLEEFEERFGKASIPAKTMSVGQGLSDELWFDGENVTVAEYFTKEYDDVEMCQLEDGRVVSADEFKELKKEWRAEFKDLLSKIEEGPQDDLGMSPQPPQGEPVPSPAMAPPQMPMGSPAPNTPPLAMPPIEEPMDLEFLNKEPKVAKRRMTQMTVIRHRIITCMEILEGGKEGNIFPGKYIPLVLLKGKELNVEGKNYVFSLIRNAKDTQKMVSYWNTAAAEVISLAPKAQFMMTPKQIEGHETAYASANIDNSPVLLFNVDPENPGPPMRQQPPNVPSAIFEQIRRGEENVKSVIGMFNADVGGPTSQQTGVAMAAAQRPGDIATFEFMENLARAINYTGRILNEMIPEIYDSERDVRIRNMDESESFTPINTTAGSALEAFKANPEQFSGKDAVELTNLFSKDGKDAKFNDVTIGKYDVVVTTGPSYATQRQESAQHLLQLVQAMPQQMSVAADILVKSMDFQDADELAARLRKSLPPGIAKPLPGDPPVTQPPPPPQVLLAQAKLEAQKAKNEEMKLKIEESKLKLQSEQIRLQKESQPEPPKQVDPMEQQMAQMKLQMEQIRAKGESDRLQAEKEAAGLRAQIAQSKAQFEIQKQQLAIQFQREEHQVKLTEIAANKEKRAPRRRAEV